MPHANASVSGTSVPDYEYLASEVIRLLVQMRPQQKVPHEVASGAPQANASSHSVAFGNPPMDVNDPEALAGHLPLPPLPPLPPMPLLCPPSFPEEYDPASNAACNCGDADHSNFSVSPVPFIPPDLMEIGRGSIGVLGALSHLGGQATPKDLSQSTGLSKGRISNIIRGLEEKGYVQKRPSPTDSRSITVALSPKGHEITDRHTAALRAHVASMLQQLGPQDAEDGVRVMRHLAQILTGKRNQPSQGDDR